MDILISNLFKLRLTLDRTPSQGGNVYDPNLFL